MHVHLLLFSLFLLLALPLRAQEQPGVTVHVVQRGETLLILAERYGLTVEQLTALNSLPDINSLEVGQRLLVPTAQPAQPVTHTVQPGESLRSIAELYALDPFVLADANGVTASAPLFVGQVLTIPVVVVSPTPSETASSVEAVTIAPVIPVDTVTVVPAPTAVFHTVMAGETLYRIAQAYGSDVAALASANSISDPTLIYAGQQLLIPGVEPLQIALDLPAPVTDLTVNPLILVEGQTGRLALSATAPVTVTGTFLGRTFSFAPLNPDATEQLALVGIPMFTDGGVYPLELTVIGSDGAAALISANIQVVSGSYGSEYINLLADRTDLLDPNVEAAEQDLITRVMSSVTPNRYFDAPMSLPAAATMTSPYGTRRSYNGGGFDRFHQGTDFAGVPGTPVLASAPGIVVLSDLLNVRGNAIIIDHGWGVYTGYWHQTERYVQVGDSVQTGQIIGTIGSTGRVTGAHLHWELWVGVVPVDPMQWVRQPFL